MTNRSALIIRHVPYEGVAGFRAPIEAAGYAVTRVDVSDESFPDVDLTVPDLVIMMGGPMGVYEQEAHPWITCQLRRLVRRLEANRPTLGVCFGAQMIAAALGGTVYAGSRPEVGWHPVAVHDPSGPLRHLTGVPVLHWHGDTFTQPAGTEILAATPAYAHQAFRRGPNVLALQFHAEMGLDPRYDAWLAEGGDMMARAGTDPATMRDTHDRLGAGAVAAGQAMLADWLANLVH
jgi:GMP synthase (glutamine-hydrolysing)